jgi:quercetin dioxygenase-like cupin family protein
MPVIRDADSRRTETPTGVMTTLASPTQGGCQYAMWRVDMAAGAAGPRHAFDTDQVWTVLRGAARIELGDEMLAVAVGDTVIMPADAQRQVFADADHGFTAIACAPGNARVYRQDLGELSPTFAINDGDKILPNWIA